MVDVPRLKRRLGSLMIDTSPYHTCRIITNPETCDECRRYAQELAADAGSVVMKQHAQPTPALIAFGGTHHFNRKGDDE